MDAALPPVERGRAVDVAVGVAVPVAVGRAVDVEELGAILRSYKRGDIEADDLIEAGAHAGIGQLQLLRHPVELAVAADEQLDKCALLGTELFEPAELIAAVDRGVARGAIQASDRQLVTANRTECRCQIHGALPGDVSCTFRFDVRCLQVTSRLTVSHDLLLVNTYQIDLISDE